MPENPFKKNYRTNLEKSLIIILLLVSGLFYSFPEGPRAFKGLPSVPAPALTIVDIPRTVQQRSELRPKPSRPVIPVPADDPEALADVTIDFQLMVSEGESIQVLSAEQVSRLSFIPRQVLEVIPKAEPGRSGSIKLSLHIGRNGKVLEYKILENTMAGRETVNRVIQAVKKSTWQSIRLDHTQYEYWIEKTYVFE